VNHVYEQEWRSGAGPHQPSQTVTAPPSSCGPRRRRCLRWAARPRGCLGRCPARPSAHTAHRGARRRAARADPDPRPCRRPRAAQADGRTPHRHGREHPEGADPVRGQLCGLAREQTLEHLDRQRAEESGDCLGAVRPGCAGAMAAGARDGAAPMRVSTPYMVSSRSRPLPRPATPPPCCRRLARSWLRPPLAHRVCAPRSSGGRGPAVACVAWPTLVRDQPSSCFSM
jgi:hypothetical protein